jgi:subtilisin family serine protease/N-acetylneuraminic acid mutarotase
MRGSRRAGVAVSVVVLAGLLVPGQPEPEAPPDPEWLSQLEPALRAGFTAQGEADFFVSFEARADLSGAAAITDWGERGAYVVERLRATAAASQGPAIELLDVAGVRYRPYWIANTILVRDGGTELARQLVAQPAVAGLHQVAMLEAPELLPSQDAAVAGAAEWGVAAVGAPRVWDDFDVRGEEIVVANIDTGVAFDHPELAARYRGRAEDGTIDHNYHWFDPAGVCDRPAPCDNHGHGTHTMGTIAGGDAGGTAIGVAPGARWVAVKGCEALTNVGCTTGALLAAGEWTLAPTDLNGQNPRPDLRPHIVNNSWGAPNGPALDPWYDQIVAAWTAAGTFALFSSGNDGQRGCDTTASPADSLAAYSVGAHDEQRQPAEFSSRGPGADGEIRPNLSAPGVAVRSSIPGGYASANGTSMAAPHVAGTVALMWSAAPSLVGDVAGTRELLDQTAVDTEDLSCGGTPERNNVFGEGRLDAYAAVVASPVGSTGVLTGQVTDTATGTPVPRATVRAESAGYRRVTTADAEGRYAIALLTGAYQVTVSAYGYQGRTVDAAVAEGERTVLDVPLAALPSVTLTGTVTDGSGHGWPLYAGITIDGYPHGTVYTDPATGRYRVVLPASNGYRLRVQATYDGYDPLTRDITVGADDMVVDLALAASTEECVAAGYQPAHLGVYSGFDTGGPPDGWRLESSVGEGWRFDDPGRRTNLTGGSGSFASIDSADGGVWEDGFLVSPVADLSQSAEPILSFRTDLLLSRGMAEVDLSTDAGATWENLWRSGSHRRGPQLERLPIPQAAGQTAVQVRFHYRNDLSFNGWWQVDEVLVGERTCRPVPGGLVVGRVTDDRTGGAVNGATVAGPGAPVSTVETPDDPAVGGGFYWLFAPPGQHRLGASHETGQYHPAGSTVEVIPNRVARADFALSSGELAVSVSGLAASTQLGGGARASLTLTNLGTAPTSFQLAERTEPAAPVDPAEADWVRLHDAPVAWADLLGAVHDGKLYLVGGSTGIAQRNMVYDIGEDRWSFTGSFMDTRRNPAGDFIGDRLYVVGGDGPTGLPVATTMVYDPAADAWSAAADAPHPFAGAGSAVLDGELYVVGGRTGADSVVTAGVMVYDPVADAWRTVADYPEPVVNQACGVVDGLLYCAGGQGADLRHLRRAYVYHPAADRWFRIADLPLSVARAGRTAANGQFLLSGGVVGGYRSNQGFAYDPASGGWSELPGSLFAVDRMASACGFFKAAGFLNPSQGNVPWAEHLPGFDDCDTSAGDRVPWLAAAPAAGTLAPGESVTVTVTLDGRVAQPGSLLGRLLVLEDAPGRVAPVPVTLRVTPPPSWGRVTGSVTGLDRCDRPGDPLAGANVSIGDARVTTDRDGRYEYWLPADRHRRVTVTAQADGWLAGSRQVSVRAGLSVTANLTLRRDEPCAGVTPEEIILTMRAGERRWVPITLDNEGAVGYDYQLAESTYRLDPLATETGWADGAELPLGVFDYAHAQCPDRPDQAYLFGGTDALLFEPSRKSWRYDAVSDTWQELARMPAPMTDAVAVCEAGQIHVLGGLGSDRHYVYDIARNTWQEAAPLPVARAEAAAAAWNGRIYLAGGTTDGSWLDTLNTVDVYEITSDTWQPGNPLPVATRSPGFAQVGPALYVVGGRDRNLASPLLDVVQRLDLATGGWSFGPPLALPRADMAVAATDRALYVLGGYGTSEWGETQTATVQRLALSDWDGGVWTADSVAELPVGRSSGQAGFCTEGRTGGEIWSVAGAGGATRALFHAVPGESCPTLAADVPWLTIPRWWAEGTVPADRSQWLSVLVDTRELRRGTTHTATLLVTTTDPGAPQLRIPVTVRIR